MEILAALIIMSIAFGITMYCLYDVITFPLIDVSTRILYASAFGLLALCCVIIIIDCMKNLV